MPPQAGVRENRRNCVPRYPADRGFLHRFTPAPWTVADCEIDLRPGGTFRTVMWSPEGEEFPNVGCYLKVTPNERLVWANALPPGYSPSEKAFFTAIVTLEPQGNGTQYTATAPQRRSISLSVTPSRCDRLTVRDAATFVAEQPRPRVMRVNELADPPAMPPAHRRHRCDTRRPSRQPPRAGRTVVGLIPPRPSRSGSAATSRRGNSIPRRHRDRSRVGRSWCRSRERAREGHRCPSRPAGP